MITVLARHPTHHHEPHGHGYPAQMPVPCTVPNCHRDHVAKGYCLRHYKIWRRHGTPTPNRDPLTTAPRDCWLTTTQLTAYLDRDRTTTLTWVTTHNIDTYQTGNTNTPPRARSWRYRLKSIDNAARPRGRRPATTTYPVAVLLRTSQTADYLGIGRMTLLDWITTGRITPTTHTGTQHAALFSLADLIELTATHTSRTPAPT